MEKLQKLKEKISSYKKVVIAFSGGVDSALLLAVAKQVLGSKNILAITAKGVMTSQSNYNQALEFARLQEVKCLTVEIDNFDLPEFVENRKDRCYACKKKIFQEIMEAGKSFGFSVCLEGSNQDDDLAYRPGKKAMEELGVISPLKDCGFTKKEIRETAKILELPVWNKPSDSCLATRFPYHQNLTKEMFYKVEKAESYLKEIGVKTCRVRVHGEIARIEVEQKDFKLFLSLSEEVIACMRRIKKLGFLYLTLDLDGFRSGSLDEIASEGL